MPRARDLAAAAASAMTGRSVSGRGIARAKRVSLTPGCDDLVDQMRAGTLTARRAEQIAAARARGPAVLARVRQERRDELDEWNAMTREQKARVVELADERWHERTDDERETYVDIVDRVVRADLERDPALDYLDDVEGTLLAPPDDQETNE